MRGRAAAAALRVGVRRCGWCAALRLVYGGDCGGRGDRFGRRRRPVRHAAVVRWRTAAAALRATAGLRRQRRWPQRSLWAAAAGVGWCVLLILIYSNVFVVVASTCHHNEFEYPNSFLFFKIFL